VGCAARKSLPKHIALPSNERIEVEIRSWPTDFAGGERCAQSLKARHVLRRYLLELFAAF
jgi:hypothetical protein